MNRVGGGWSSKFNASRDRTDVRTDVRIDVCTDVHTGVCSGIRTDARTDVYSDIRTDVRTDNIIRAVVREGGVKFRGVAEGGPTNLRNVKCS